MHVWKDNQQRNYGMLKIFSFLLFLYIKIDHEIQPFTAKEHLSWILLRSLSTWRKNELFTKDYLNLEWIFVTFECCCFCLKQKQKRNYNKKHYLKPKIFYVISLLKEHLLGEILIISFNGQLVWHGKDWKLKLQTKSAVLQSFQFLFNDWVSCFLSMPKAFMCNCVVWLSN